MNLPLASQPEAVAGLPRPAPITRWRWVSAGIVGGLVLLVCALITSLWQYRRENADEDRRYASHEVRYSLEALLVQTLNLQTGARGYLLSGDERYLAPFSTGLAQINGAVARLEHLTAADPERHGQVRILAGLATEALALHQDQIAARRAEGLEAALTRVPLRTSKDLVDRIRRDIGAMEQTERQQLETRAATMVRSRRLALTSLLGSGALGLTALGLTALALRHHQGVMFAQRLAVQQAEQERSRRMELEKIEAELRRSLEENARLNAELQHGITRLKASNQELEAFSYSVSHDLRAPLRGVDGFARLLEEDQGAQLDAEGRRRLGIIRAEAQRMGRLIDALLAFSRLGRQQLAPGPVDLQALAQEAWATLTRATPERAAQLALTGLPATRGDPVLLQQVFANLLGNALKFTRHQPAPVIEVGGRAGPAEHTYFVRDNGAGFDPRHADKLFGVFQRLHREDEFEGTGIGLALVQRIIHRHGGRIWAEGAPGRGATFCFTLPVSPPTAS